MSSTGMLQNGAISMTVGQAQSIQDNVPRTVKSLILCLL